MTISCICLNKNCLIMNEIDFDDFFEAEEGVNIN